MLEGVVVGVSEVGVGFAVEGGELAGYVCEVSGSVMRGVRVVSWFARVLRARTFLYASRGEMCRPLYTLT